MTDADLMRMYKSSHGSLCDVLRDIYYAAIEDAINCYSPDDSAKDWMDKMAALKPE